LITHEAGAQELVQALLALGLLTSETCGFSGKLSC